MGTILEGYIFGKLLYHCQKPSLADHDCVQAHAHLSVKVAPTPASAIKRRVTTARLLQAGRLLPTLGIRRRFRNGLEYLRHDLSTAKQIYSKKPRKAPTTCTQVLTL